MSTLVEQAEKKFGDLIRKKLAQAFRIEECDVTVEWFFKDDAAQSVMPRITIAQRLETIGIPKSVLAKKITKALETVSPGGFVFELESRTLSNTDFAARMKQRRGA